MGGAATDGIKVVTPGPLCRQIRGHASHTRGGRFLHHVERGGARLPSAAGSPPNAEPQTRSSLPCLSPRRPHSLSWAPPRLPPPGSHRPFFLGVLRLPVTLARQFTAGSVSCGAGPERRPSCRLAVPQGPRHPLAGGDLSPQHPAHSTPWDIEGECPKTSGPVFPALLSSMWEAGPPCLPSMKLSFCKSKRFDPP